MRVTLASVCSPADVLPCRGGTEADKGEVEEEERRERVMMVYS